MPRQRPPYYEVDEAEFAGAFKVRGHGGVAWYVLGWEVAPDEDTEWSGIMERTGKVVCIMVGDDRRFVFDRDELTKLARKDYCGDCGQTGCTSNTGGG